MHLPLIIPPGYETAVLLILLAVVAAVGLLGLSACGLVLTVAVGGGAVWYWRRRRTA